MDKEIVDGLEDLKTRVHSLKKSLGVVPQRRKVKRKKITATEYNRQMDKILSNRRKKVYTLLLEALDFAGSVEIVDKEGEYEKA